MTKVGGVEGRSGSAWRSWALAPMGEPVWPRLAVWRGVVAVFAILEVASTGGPLVTKVGGEGAKGRCPAILGGGTCGESSVTKVGSAG